MVNHRLKNMNGTPRAHFSTFKPPIYTYTQNSTARSLRLVGFRVIKSNPYGLPGKTRHRSKRLAVLLQQTAKKNVDQSIGLLEHRQSSLCFKIHL